MRAAVLSDIHGNDVALKACLADLAERGGADVIVAAGDLCMDGPRPDNVLERLQDVGARCIRGNTDRTIGGEDLTGLDPEEVAAVQWQRDRLGPEWTAWLGALPFATVVGEGAGALLVCHANPKNDTEHVWPDADDGTLERLFGDVLERTVAFGHLHLPYVRAWRDRLLVDVASAGLPKDGDPRAHYAILTHRGAGWEVQSRRVPFDVERVERQIRRSGMPDARERLDVLRRHRYKKLRPGEPIP